MQRHRPFKSCFIVGPCSANTQPLQDLLADSGIGASSPLSLARVPGSRLDALEAAIRSVDFVCAVITRTPSASVLFEAGLARGARKPLFLIVDRDARLPTALEDIFYVRASPTDVDAIKFNLQQFLQHPTKRGPTRYHTPPGPEYSNIYSDPDLEFLKRSLAEPIAEQGLRHLARAISDFLRAHDVVVHESSHPDVGADMAIWLDALESSLGNPVIVELKTGHLSEPQLKEAELQLRHSLQKTNGRVGLLVYLDQAGRRFPSQSSGSPLVVRLEANDFADLIARDELAHELVSERNKSVHERSRLDGEAIR